MESNKPSKNGILDPALPNQRTNRFDNNNSSKNANYVTLKQKRNDQKLKHDQEKKDR